MHFLAYLNRNSGSDECESATTRLQRGFDPARNRALMRNAQENHSFTHPEAGNDPSKGAAYQEAADRRSWYAMKEFFAEIFR